MTRYAVILARENMPFCTYKNQVRKAKTPPPSPLMV